LYKNDGMRKLCKTNMVETSVEKAGPGRTIWQKTGKGIFDYS